MEKLTLSFQTDCVSIDGGSSAHFDFAKIFVNQIQENRNKMHVGLPFE